MFPNYCVPKLCWLESFLVRNKQSYRVKEKKLTVHRGPEQLSVELKPSEKIGFPRRQSQS